MSNSPLLPSDDCFALLDDCDASDADPRSRLYTGYLRSLRCTDAAGLPLILEQMQQLLRDGRFAVGLFAYELGGALHGTAQRDIAEPLAEILLFDRCERMSAKSVDAWLESRARTGEERAGIANIRPGVTQGDFSEALARIHDYIDAGDTYQVNYTFRLRFDAYGSALGLYRKLRQRQPVPYGAFIAMPDSRAVLSLSPELFVRHTVGELTVRPMKGTAPATGEFELDARRAAELAADPKNRAENLMIVDLLRNDLGRIAELGSVQVPSLFDVNRYSSVLQMTSTVRARLRGDVRLSDIFNALYPCGSITGAPKRRTMQIIRELEPDARRLYTGAIGWFDAPEKSLDDEHAIGNFCMSVPIRTLLLDVPDSVGIRQGEMGVGAGIVHDSVAADEFEECRLKARFLTGLPAGFDLFETMYATREDGCRHAELHLQRLASSAAYFSFSYDADVVRATIADTCAGLPSNAPHRLRLALSQSGDMQITTAPLAPLVEPVRLLLASAPMNADDLFLRHKTTIREVYDAAWREAESCGAFDMLFFNRDGELTEGGRSSVFIKLNGKWMTPPLRAGVLPGVMRSVLLSDPAWDAIEHRLTFDDLRAANEIVVCNALRGAMRATL